MFSPFPTLLTHNLSHLSNCQIRHELSFCQNNPLLLAIFQAVRDGQKQAILAELNIIIIISITRIYFTKQKDQGHILSNDNIKPQNRNKIIIRKQPGKIPKNDAKEAKIETKLPRFFTHTAIRGYTYGHTRRHNSWHQPTRTYISAIASVYSRFFLRRGIPFPPKKTGISFEENIFLFGLNGEYARFRCLFTPFLRHFTASTC